MWSKAQQFIKYSKEYTCVNLEVVQVLALRGLVFWDQRKKILVAYIYFLSLNETFSILLSAFEDTIVLVEMSHI